jgi:peptidoglycan/xylan/chitin deacetylase (PgdA/CDA1 family)
VPENWAPVADIGGWPWASGGYFTQTFWLKAVPENWAAHDGIALGRGYYGTGGQGYYRFYFWEHAVPDNWVSQADRVGGWPWTSGGYYTQFFWWRAVPEDWLPMADHAIGGVANQGHYAFWLYHFAAPRGFAWRSGLSFRGSRGASYYFVTMHETLPPVHAEYAYLRRLTSNHLAGAAVEEPVSTWFDPAARAVVVLTFDTEGDEAQSCRLAGMLDEEEISATFLLTGTTSAPATTLAHISRAPSWQACLAGFDLGNHTAHHFGNTGFVVNLGTGQLLFNMTDASRQQSEVLDSQSLIESIFLHTPESFRAPWCDGHRSFDGGVTSTLSSVASRAPRFSSGERMLVDSSIATISSAASARGIVPPAHLADLSIDRRPFPYEIAGGANPILEVPFSYPSDWTSASLHGLSLGPPPDDTNPAFLANVWKRNLDEILASNGVMVVLAHPSIMGADADRVAALRSFIRYAKSLPGVRFSTLAEVGERFRDR